MKAFWLAAGLLLSVPAFAEDEDVDKVNGSIRIDDGQSAGDLSTVNGSIRIGDKAKARELETVNGSISMGSDATATEIENVNGSVTMGARSRLEGRIESVNGSITLDDGVEVVGSVENVNGKIRLEAARVGGGIVTTNGGIDVLGNSRVEGGIHVEKPSGSWFSFGKDDPPRIVIGPGAVVNGTLRFDREVELYVSDKATVGTIVGATPVKFAGDRPPN